MNLPERTARVVEWHDGVKLWIKTLNVWERDDAAEAAAAWTFGQMRRFRDTGSDSYLRVRDWFESQSAEEQCSFLSESGLLDGSFAALALKQWPGEAADAVAEREAWLRAETSRAYREALDLSPPLRPGLCCAEALRRRERNLRGYGLVCETLWRAVRQDANRALHHWAAVSYVRELSDEERDWFWARYEEMQLPVTLVPTSAAVLLP